MYILFKSSKFFLSTTYLRVYGALPGLMWRPEKRTTSVLATALNNPSGRYFFGLYINKYKMLTYWKKSYHETQLLAVSRDIVCVAKVWRPKYVLDLRFV